MKLSEFLMSGPGQVVCLVGFVVFMVIYGVLIYIEDKWG